MPHDACMSNAPSTPTRLAKLQQMLATDPDDAFVLYGLAQEYGKLGTPEAYRAAIEHYDRCLVADPGYLYAYYHKSALQRDHGDGEAATATARAGVEKARAARDGKALNELQALLDELE